MQENSRESVISPEEIAEAKANANHFDPRVRGKWIEFLAKNGPCAWNDLKKWAMDSEADIRWRVFYSMGNALDAAGYLCEADKGKCLSILTAAAEKYSDMQVGMTMRELAERSPEWLDATWNAVGEIIENASPELRSALTCGYLERLIPEGNWGPDEVHVRPWIVGGSVQKKMLLLKIAAFRGLDSGRMRDIVDAISHDTDPYIAWLAKGILEERVTHSDIP